MGDFKQARRSVGFHIPFRHSLISDSHLMKLIATVAISFLMTVSFSSCGQGFKNRVVLGEQSAKEQVRLAILADKNSVKPPYYKALLTSKEVAIAVAEPMLFNIYGRDNIVRQRPYEVYLVDGFWYIAGTLPKDSLGGTFEMVIDASNSRVVDVKHGK